MAKGSSAGRVVALCTWIVVARAPDAMDHLSHWCTCHAVDTAAARPSLLPVLYRTQAQSHWSLSHPLLLRMTFYFTLRTLRGLLSSMT